MAELLSLDLTSKELVTSQIVLTIGYDIENLTSIYIKDEYLGDITVDRYGRKIPKHAHGTINLDHKTSSSSIIIKAVTTLYDRIINKKLLVRRINITANNVIKKEEIKEEVKYEQLSLFVDYEALNKKREIEKNKEKRENNLQKAVVKIKSKYGKNAILKGMNFENGGTTIDRNFQIGGHRA